MIKYIIIMYIFEQQHSI